MQLVVSKDFEIFALKEVYLKHNAVNMAYILTEMNFQKLLKNVPEVATLLSPEVTAHAHNQVEDVATRHTSYI